MKVSHGFRLLLSLAGCLAAEPLLGAEPRTVMALPAALPPHYAFTLYGGLEDINFLEMTSEGRISFADTRRGHWHSLDLSGWAVGKLKQRLWPVADRCAGAIASSFWRQERPSDPVAFERESRSIFVPHRGVNQYGFVEMLRENETVELHHITDSPITSLAVASRTQRLIIGTSLGEVQVVRLSTFWPDEPINLGAPVRSLTLSPDESVLVAGLSDGSLKVFRLSRGRLSSEETIHTGFPIGESAPFPSVMVSPKGEHILMSDPARPGRMRVFTRHESVRVERLLDVGHSPHSLALDPQGRLLATAFEHEISLWDLKTLKRLASLSARESEAVTFPDIGIQTRLLTPESTPIPLGGSVYRLLFAQDFLIAGTQGGLVIWNLHNLPFGHARESEEMSPAKVRKAG